MITLHRKPHYAFAGAIALTASMFFAGAAQAEEVVPAYNSYQAVPFVVENGGLAADLVSYLNGKLKGKYQFQQTNTSRERLNQLIEKDSGFKGVVLFLNPIFVNDAEKKKYLWTAGVISDSNAVISSSTRKVEYQSPESLAGLKFAGIHGNRYAGLEEHFGKSIERENVNEELSNIKKVASGRADVTIMASSTYRYLMKQLGSQGAASSTLHVSSKPHAKFDRFLFVSKDNGPLAKELDGVIAGMKSDPAWKAILTRYGLE